MEAHSLAALAFLALVSVASAQKGPPPGERPPMAGRGTSRSAPPVPNSTTVAETIRILGLSNVQKDLGLTSAELKGLAGVARNVATEDAAVAAASRILTTAQTNRLLELLVQDMGYGALQIAAVRTPLGLSAEQTQATEAILSDLATTKRSFATANLSTARAESQTNAALAKLLTAEQDVKLRSLAGRALGSREIGRAHV